MNARGWGPLLPAGKVWYCGCGRGWGSTGQEWTLLRPEDVVQLHPDGVTVKP